MALTSTDILMTPSKPYYLNGFQHVSFRDTEIQPINVYMHTHSKIEDGFQIKWNLSRGLWEVGQLSNMATSIPRTEAHRP